MGLDFGVSRAHDACCFACEGLGSCGGQDSKLFPWGTDLSLIQVASKQSYAPPRQDVRCRGPLKDSYIAWANTSRNIFRQLQTQMVKAQLSAWLPKSIQRGSNNSGYTTRFQIRLHKPRTEHQNTKHAKTGLAHFSCPQENLRTVCCPRC